MKILNLHGFLGEADNKNYKILCETISPENIISPQLDYKKLSPTEILSALFALIDSDSFIFVGQSLGGWYADKLSRKLKMPCILTNPCYYPHNLDIISDSGIPHEYLEQYSTLSVYNKNPYAYTLCSDADTILPDNYANCISLSSVVKKVHGSHSTIENLSDPLKEALNYLKK